MMKRYRLSTLFPALVYWSHLPAFSAFIGMLAGTVCGWSHPIAVPPRLYVPLLVSSTVFWAALLLVSPHRWYSKVLLGGLLGLTNAGLMHGNYVHTVIQLPASRLEHCSMSGTVVSMPVKTTYGWRWNAILDSMVTSEGAVAAREVSVLLRSDSCPLPGTMFLCRGTFSPPQQPVIPGGFNEYLWHASAGRAGTVLSRQLRYLSGHKPAWQYRITDNFRAYAFKTLTHMPKAEHRAILAAAFLGVRQLDKETIETFRKAGLSHLLALSGLHVGILSAFIMALLWPVPLPQYCKYLVTVPVLWAYAFVAGAQPSLFRAVAMFSVLALSFSVQRKSHPLNVLGTAGILWLILEPASVFGAAFQLSWSATAGIILFYPWLKQRLAIADSLRGVPVRMLLGAGLVSTSAFAGTLPVLAWHFGEISLFGLFANVFSVFVMAGAVWMYAGALVVQGSFPWLAAIVLKGASGLLTFLVSCASLAHVIPFAVVFVPRPPMMLCLLYAMFVVGLAAVKKGLTRTYLSVWALFIFVLTPAALLAAYTEAPDAEVVILPAQPHPLFIVRVPGHSAVLLNNGSDMHAPRTRQLFEDWVKVHGLRDPLSSWDDHWQSFTGVARYSLRQGLIMENTPREQSDCHKEQVCSRSSDKAPSWSVRAHGDTLILTDGLREQTVLGNAYGVQSFRNDTWEGGL